LQQLVQVDGFDEERGEFGPGEESNLTLYLIRRESRDQHDRKARAIVLYVRQYVEPVDAGHLQVEQEQVDRAVAKVLDRRAPVVGLVNIVPFTS